MTKKRIIHKQIQNERKRNSTYEKRAEGLLKKANELSILCGVNIAIVVHKQSGENNSILWPSPPTSTERMNKFMELSDMERNKRLVTHENFMEQMVSSETVSLLKLRKKIVDTESHQLMTELTQGKNFSGLDLYQLNCLNSLAGDVIKKVTEDELKTWEPLPPGVPLQPPSELAVGWPLPDVGGVHAPPNPSNEFVP